MDTCLPLMWIVDYNLCSECEVAAYFIHNVTRSYVLASSVRLLGLE